MPIPVFSMWVVPGIGPLFEAGSDGDNGQTGRKLVMDFYGPRVPIGGGALSGRHLTHIDGAYAAREAAVRAVRSGADECLVRLAYAPNHIEPIDVFYKMSGWGERQRPILQPSHNGGSLSGHRHRGGTRAGPAFSR